MRASADRVEFAGFFRGEFARLAGYCAGIVGDREMGKDLAQEALARTWSRWPQVRDPHGYAYVVATRLARRCWRDQIRSDQLRGAYSEEASVTPASDLSVRDLVERLPIRLRKVTVLHYYADLSVEQIASILHRPKGTIRQRLHEARRLIARELVEETRR